MDERPAKTHNAILDWSDLRLVLIVAETGSLNATATRLAVAHTTVLRRLDTIEGHLGMPLFERSRSGLRLTPVIESALPALARMAEAADEVVRRFAGSSETLSGSLRVTTTDTLAVTLVRDLMVAFGEAHPNVVVELTTSNTFMNLTKREADVAIRPATGVPEALLGRRIGTIPFAVYARADFTAGDALRWIGLDDSLAGTAAGRWLSANVGGGVAVRCDSFVAARELAAAGLGRAVLPCYLGDADPRIALLQAVDAPSELWVLAHADLARSARVRTFTQFAANHLRRALTASSGQP